MLEEYAVREGALFNTRKTDKLKHSSQTIKRRFYFMHKWGTRDADVVQTQCVCGGTPRPFNPPSPQNNNKNRDFCKLIHL